MMLEQEAILVTHGMVVGALAMSEKAVMMVAGPLVWLAVGLCCQ